MTGVMTGFAGWLLAHQQALTLWVGALCTLGLYSVLYRENRIYRLFEHLFLGLATGYLVAKTWTDVLLPKWWEPMIARGQWWLIFALVVGLGYYLAFSRKYNWLSRLVIGFFLGTTAGQAFQIFVNDTWPQIPSSFKPLLPHPAYPAVGAQAAIAAVTPAEAINNAVFLIILLCVMSYFFFSIEQKNRLLQGSARAGRWMMMFAFGAIFGATMMARMALLIDRMDFLVNEFGPHIGGPKVMFALILALVTLMLVLAVRGSKSEQEAQGEP